MNSLLVVTRPELLIIHVIWNLRAGGEVFIFAGGGGGGGGAFLGRIWWKTLSPIPASWSAFPFEGVK